MVGITFFLYVHCRYAKIHIPIIASVSEHQPTTWTSFFFDLHILLCMFPAGVWFVMKDLKDERLFGKYLFVYLCTYAADMTLNIIIIFLLLQCMYMVMYVVIYFLLIVIFSCAICCLSIILCWCDGSTDVNINTYCMCQCFYCFFTFTG